MRQRRSPKPPGRKRTLDVVIDHIGAKGDGVAMVDGAAIFVPATAPGDRARIDAVGDRGKLLDLYEKSVDRAPAPCRYFGRCGGCALQHVSVAFYQSWKKALVADALAAAGVDVAELADPVAISRASRRRAQFYVERRGREMRFGFYERRSRNLIAVEECLILHGDLSRRLPALQALAAAAPQDWRAFSLSATVCDNGLDINLDHRAPLSDPDPADLAAMSGALKRAGGVRLSLQGDALATFAAPTIALDGVALSPPPGGFLQASAEGEAALIGLVRNAVGDARKVADLFCGAGTFSLPLAKSSTVTAIDSDLAATDALRAAAASSQRRGDGLRPVSVDRRNLFERPMGANELKPFDAVVMDPPRAGALAQAREIAASGADTVVFVSCNPKTFARDARAMADGGYALESVTPVDQFVYAAHIEIVGVFRRA